MFQSRIDPSVKLLMHCNGKKLNERAAKNFEEILFSPALNIEGDGCERVVRYIPPNIGSGGMDNCRLRAGQLKDRRVLIWNREWNEENQSAVHYIVDAVGDASVLIDLAFIAPKPLFLKYLPEAEQIIQSINWIPLSQDGEWKNAGPWGLYVNGESLKSRTYSAPQTSYNDWLVRNPCARNSQV
jgi:hypothetical protein